MFLASRTVISHCIRRDAMCYINHFFTVFWGIKALACLLMSQSHRKSSLPLWESRLFLFEFVFDCVFFVCLTTKGGSRCRGGSTVGGMSCRNVGTQLLSAAAALPGLRRLCSGPSKLNLSPPPLPSVKAAPPSSSHLLTHSKSRGTLCSRQRKRDGAQTVPVCLSQSGWQKALLRCSPQQDWCHAVWLRHTDVTKCITIHQVLFMQPCLSFIPSHCC